MVSQRQRALYHCLPPHLFVLQYPFKSPSILSELRENKQNRKLPAFPWLGPGHSSCPTGPPRREHCRRPPLPTSARLERLVLVIPQWGIAASLPRVLRGPTESSTRAALCPGWWLHPPCLPSLACETQPHAEPSTIISQRQAMPQGWSPHFWS